MGAFLAITASVLLAMGRGFLHFRSVLSNSPFVVFTTTSAAVASLQFSGGSHLTLPDLWPGIYLMAVTLHVVLAPQFIVRCNSLVPELLSGPSQIQCPHGSYSELHSFFSFFSQVLRLFMWIFVPPVVHGSGDMDPLALPSPRLLQVGEVTLAFSISLVLRFSSLLAFVVWPEVIHEAGVGRVEGNPVRAHSFRSLSFRSLPSNMVHLQCARGSYLGDHLSLCFVSSKCFHHDFMFFVPWVCL